MRGCSRGQTRRDVQFTQFRRMVHELSSTSVHSGASPHSRYFCHVPPAVGKKLQLLHSPIGNQNFQKTTKQNIANEKTPHGVPTALHLHSPNLCANKMHELLALQTRMVIIWAKYPVESEKLGRTTATLMLYLSFLLHGDRRDSGVALRT